MVTQTPRFASSRFYTSRRVAIDVDASITGTRARAVMERLAGARGPPHSITEGPGSECGGRALDAQAYRANLRRRFILPTKPSEKAYIESCNGTRQDECLNGSCFATMIEDRQFVDA